MKRTLIACGLGLALICTARAADFWLEKPYTQWREKEARQILTGSPWTYVYQWGYIGSIQQNIAGTGDSERRIRGHPPGPSVLGTGGPPGLRRLDRSGRSSPIQSLPGYREPGLSR